MEKDLSFFEQMVKSMEDLEPSLEKYYKEEDVENFNKIKKIMLDVQKRISERIDAI